MGFWPFKRKEPEQLSAAELRDRLIKTAASGSHKQLLALCQKFKLQVADNLDLLRRVPEEIRADQPAAVCYIQFLSAVATCLAEECGAPELLNLLCGTPETNPLKRWEKWYAQFEERLDRLEYVDLIAEANKFIEEAQELDGPGARYHEACLHARLGLLLFHSGDVAGSIPSFQASLAMFQNNGRVEGERSSRNNLVEAYRYLGNIAEAIRVGDEAIQFASNLDVDCDRLRRQVMQMKKGEPLCRVVIVQGDNEIELDEWSPRSEGRYEFQFRRNRLSLQMVSKLVRRGDELATSGKLADAMEKYQMAMEVDPYDPAPVYQSGICLMELGAYAKAKEAFAEVEQLAPGWFRCRFDRWMAESLDGGTVTEDEYHLLRVLEHGGLPVEQATTLALQAIETFPDFASFHLILGDTYQRQGNNAQAIECYRKGISLAVEPDLKSRLLCAAAGALPADSPERKELMKLAADLEGSLVAKAMLAFIPLN